jgi:ABC-type lipoprotein export system ATPase subunit
MVTHEAEIAEYAKSRLHLRDGKVQAVEGAGA